jgi:hypothetical protein
MLTKKAMIDNDHSDHSPKRKQRQSTAPSSPSRMNNTFQPPPVTAPRNKQELNISKAKVVSPETDDALHDKDISQCSVMNSRMRPHPQGKQISIEKSLNPPCAYHSP